MSLWSFDGNKPKVESSTFVSPLAEIIGNVIIGKGCYIGHGVLLRGDYGTIEIGDNCAIEEKVFIHAPIIHNSKIDDYAVIGMGAVLSLFSEVGLWSIVAEGSVVKMRQVDPYMVAAGNPTKTVREVSEKDREFWLGGKQRYIDLAQKYIHEGMHRID